MMPHGGFRFAGIARLQRSKNSAMLRQRLFGATRMGARTEAIDTQQMVEIVAEMAFKPDVAACARDAEMKILVTAALEIGFPGSQIGRC